MGAPVCVGALIQFVCYYISISNQFSIIPVGNHLIMTGKNWVHTNDYNLFQDKYQRYLCAGLQKVQCQSAGGTRHWLVGLGKKKLDQNLTKILPNLTKFDQNFTKIYDWEKFGTRQQNLFLEHCLCAKYGRCSISSLGATASRGSKFFSSCINKFSENVVSLKKLLSWLFINLQISGWT